MEKITAPWTAEQVDALNAFQRLGYLHPFTCSGHEGGGDRDLIATRAGWICCHCDYKQDWAQAGMLKPPADPTAAMWKESVEILADIKLRVTAVRIQTRVDVAQESGSPSIAIGASLASEAVRAMNDAAEFIDGYALKRTAS